jgi:hypothetical protein
MPESNTGLGVQFSLIRSTVNLALIHLLQQPAVDFSFSARIK